MKKLLLLILMSLLYQPIQISSQGFIASAYEKTKGPVFALASSIASSVITLAVSYFVIQKIASLHSTTIQSTNFNPLESTQTFENLHRDIPEMFRVIADMYKNPEKYAGSPTPEGIVLHGEPGSGKTELVKALAGEGVPVFFTNGAQFLARYVGSTEENIRAFYTTAEQFAKKTGRIAVVFIDECESIAGDRTSMDQSHARATVTQLLTCIEDTKNVITIGATNLPKLLDNAIIRPGRLGTHIKIKSPTTQEKSAILDATFKQYSLKRSKSLENLIKEDASKLEYYSTASIVQIVKKCSLLRTFRNQEFIGTTIYKEALQLVPLYYNE